MQFVVHNRSAEIQFLELFLPRGLNSMGAVGASEPIFRLRCHSGSSAASQDSLCRCCVVVVVVVVVLCCCSQINFYTRSFDVAT